jgi:hypothetical protein
LISSIGEAAENVAEVSAVHDISESCGHTPNDDPDPAEVSFVVSGSVTLDLARKQWQTRATWSQGLLTQS